ncbi:MAG: L-threonylcarbamoyladenylate synthase [Candidatus Hodarchaeota archaeon]
MRISVNDANIISIATNYLHNGSIAIFPTDTSYGLGCIGLRWNEENIKRIYIIKNRPLDKPLSLLISKDMISEYIETSPFIRDFLDKVWPSRLTAILNCSLKATKKLSSLLNINNPQKLAFRVPQHDLLLKIIEKVDSPIIGTSANKSGLTAIYDFNTISQELSSEYIKLSIDAGKLPRNPPSTLVDLSDPLNPILLREGSVNFQKIFRSKMQI